MGCKGEEMQEMVGLEIWKKGKGELFFNYRSGEFILTRDFTVCLI